MVAVSFNFLEFNINQIQSVQMSIFWIIMQHCNLQSYWQHAVPRIVRTLRVCMDVDVCIFRTANIRMIESLEPRSLHIVLYSLILLIFASHGQWSSEDKFISRIVYGYHSYQCIVVRNGLSAHICIAHRLCGIHPAWWWWSFSLLNWPPCFTCLCFTHPYSPIDSEDCP